MADPGNSLRAEYFHSLQPVVVLSAHTDCIVTTRAEGENPERRISTRLVHMYYRISLHKGQ